MEVVAAFVFASGGVARPDELHDLFVQQPAVRAQLTAAELKRAVARDGAAHGLAWLDAHPRERGAVVVHELTAAQREGGAREFADEARRVPRAFAALEQLVRAQPKRQLRSGALSDFYRAFPLESAFMKRRSGGVVAFVRQYDPAQRRLVWDDRGGLHVPEEYQQDGAPEDSEASSLEWLGTATGQQVDEAHARVYKKALTAEPAPEPESDSKRHLEGAGCAQTPCSDSVANEKSPDELRLATCTSPTQCDDGVAESLVRSLRPPADFMVVVSVFPRVLLALERVVVVVAQARAPPRLHPLALLVVAFERRQRAQDARRLARRAARRISAVRESCPPLAESDPLGDMLVLSSVAELLLPAKVENATRAFNVAENLSVLARVTLVLRQAASLPAPHPVFVRLVAWECRRQSRRARRAALRSKALEKEAWGAMSILLIPRATLELLTLSVLAPAQPAAAAVMVDSTLHVD